MLMVALLAVLSNRSNCRTVLTVAVATTCVALVVRSAGELLQLSLQIVEIDSWSLATRPIFQRLSPLANQRFLRQVPLLVGAAASMAMAAVLTGALAPPPPATPYLQCIHLPLLVSTHPPSPEPYLSWLSCALQQALCPSPLARRAVRKDPTMCCSSMGCSTSRLLLATPLSLLLQLLLRTPQEWNATLL